MVNPKKQLYNCFGCDAKGDVLSFLQAQEQLSFSQAVMRLRELVGEAKGPGAASPAPSAPDKFEGWPHSELSLEKVCQHYQLGLEGSEVAREYLQQRKLWDSEAYEGFRFGYCDGSLLKAIRKSGTLRDALREIGISTPKARNTSWVAWSCRSFIRVMGLWLLWSAIESEIEGTASHSCLGRSAGSLAIRPCKRLILFT